MIVASSSILEGVLDNSKAQDTHYKTPSKLDGTIPPEKAVSIFSKGHELAGLEWTKGFLPTIKERII